MASNASVLPNERKMQFKKRKSGNDYLVTELSLDQVSLLFKFYGEPAEHDEVEGFEGFGDYPLDSDVDDEDHFHANEVESNFEWVKDPVTPRHIIFGDSFLKINPKRQKPKAYFDLLFTEEFFNTIIANTNKKGSQLFVKPSSSKWKDVNRDELESFFAIFFGMGSISMGTAKDYWTFKKNMLPRIHSQLTAQMSADRYLQICKAFCFTDDILTSKTTSEDSVYKILPLLNYFSKVMENVHSPGRELLINESVIPWGVNASTSKYRMLRSQKYGIQLFLLLEPNGIIHRIIVYAGTFNVKLAHELVHKMLKGLKHGHSLYLNKTLNSVTLIKEILDKEKCYCTGPLYLNRKDNPKSVVEKNLEKNQLFQQWMPNDGICVSKWLGEKKTVFMASSEFSGSLIETSKDGVLVEWPHSAVKYSKNKTGIYHIEENLMFYRSYYQTLPWYTRFQFRIIELMFLNSFLLYKKYSHQYKDYFHYRFDVIKLLCKLYDSFDEEDESEESE